MKLSERAKYGIAAGSGFALLIMNDVTRMLYPSACPEISGSLSDYATALWISSMTCAFHKHVSKELLVCYSASVPIVYTLSEFGQKFGLLPGTFDEKDILGFALGGLTTLVLGLAMNYFDKPQTHSTR